MAEAHRLANDLKAFIEVSSPVGNLSEDTLAKVVSATNMFPLAPDEYVDVKRIPQTVTTFQHLVDYLTTIQTKIKSRPPGKSNQDWDVAQKGELKLYKLLVCGLHAIAAYTAQGDAVDLDRPLNEVSDDTIAYARATPPGGLSQNGTTLWNATFSGAVPRTKACVNTIYYLLSREVGQPADGNDSDMDSTALDAST